MESGSWLLSRGREKGRRGLTDDADAGSKYGVGSEKQKSGNRGRHRNARVRGEDPYQFYPLVKQDQDFKSLTQEDSEYKYDIQKYHTRQLL